LLSPNVGQPLLPVHKAPEVVANVAIERRLQLEVIDAAAVEVLDFARRLCRLGLPYYDGRWGRRVTGEQ
jgi:hypothetical protein